MYMAIIGDDGKIRGTIGKHVYRIVNNRGIIQSHPGTLKPKGDTVEENIRFGKASEFTSCIYPAVKRFGLNMCYSYVYGKLVNYFKRILYTDLMGNSKGEYFYLDEKNSLSKVFKGIPKAEKNGSIISIEVPDVQEHRVIARSIQGNHLEYRMQLWVLNYESTDMTCVLRETTERLQLSKQIKAQEIKIDLSSLKYDIFEKKLLSELKITFDEGLLILCFGVQFFEDHIDTVGNNTKKFNPACILGAWHLGGHYE